MKVSLVVSILILLIAVLISSQRSKELVNVQRNHAQLVATATLHGISINPSITHGSLLSTKRKRYNNEEDVKAVAAMLIAIAKEWKVFQSGGSIDKDLSERRAESQERLMLLDSSQLHMLMTELRGAKGLEDESIQNLLGRVMMRLATVNPQAALRHLTQSSDLDKKTTNSSSIVSSALATWAKGDPNAALEWFRKNNLQFPILNTDDVKSALISGAAHQDTSLAFNLVSELEIKDKSEVLSKIASLASTPEKRAILLASLRQHLATLTDEQTIKDASQSVLYKLSVSVIDEGFDSGSQWLALQNMTATEFEFFSIGIYASVENGETGQWIEWIADKLPPDKASHRIDSIVKYWTRNDYQATGHWLTTLQDGPTRITAVHSYAKAISRYEPETAAQWALTLPPSEERQKTLQSIHASWPAADSDGKAAFQKEHGIESD